MILNMEMTFQQYIDNPMGRRNAVFSQRDMYKTMYTEKFNQVFLREAGKINYTTFIDKSKDRYAIHIKIPSETVKDFYYDAVILFYTNDAEKHASPSLQDYNVKFFSNDPAFVFTYLHVFLKNDLLIEDLKSKCSKMAIKKFPKEKNPYGVPGYSKILYFAFLFMKMKNLFAKTAYQNGTQYSAKKLAAEVEHSDKKIADRQEAGEKQAKQAAIDKRKTQQQTSAQRTVVSTPTGNIRSSKMTNTVGKTGGVKRTSTVKKIGRK